MEALAALDVDVAFPNRKPQFATHFDPRWAVSFYSGLGAGPYGLAPFAARGIVPAFVITGGSKLSPQLDGWAATAAAAGNSTDRYGCQGSSITWAPSQTRGTCLVAVRALAASGADSTSRMFHCYGDTVGTSYLFTIYCNGTNLTAGWISAGSDDRISVARSGSLWASGDLVVFALSYDSAAATRQILYINGVQKGTKTVGAPGAPTAANNSILFTGFPGQSLGCDWPVLYVAWCDRQLGAEDVAWISRNPLNWMFLPGPITKAAVSYPYNQFSQVCQAVTTPLKTLTLRNAVIRPISSSPASSLLRSAQELRLNNTSPIAILTRSAAKLAPATTTPAKSLAAGKTTPSALQASASAVANLARSVGKLALATATVVTSRLLSAGKQMPSSASATPSRLSSSGKSARTSSPPAATLAVHAARLSQSSAAVLAALTRQASVLHQSTASATASLLRAVIKTLSAVAAAAPSLATKRVTVVTLRAASAASATTLRSVSETVSASISSLASAVRGVGKLLYVAAGVMAASRQGHLLAADAQTAPPASISETPEKTASSLAEVRSEATRAARKIDQAQTQGIASLFTTGSAVRAFLVVPAIGALFTSSVLRHGRRFAGWIRGRGGAPPKA